MLLRHCLLPLLLLQLQSTAPYHANMIEQLAHDHWHDQARAPWGVGREEGRATERGGGGGGVARGGGRPLPFCRTAFDNLALPFDHPDGVEVSSLLYTVLPPDWPPVATASMVPGQRRCLVCHSLTGLQ